MLSWFRAKRPKDDFNQRLARLEEHAASASNGYETQHLLQAADLCARAGHADRAMRYYGQVLDCYLETGRLAAAEALCRKMLGLAPAAARVRGTRMWLVAARGSWEEIRVAMTEYVQVGTAAAQEGLVAHQLGLLAEASTLEVRELAAEALLDLGAFEESERWLGAVYAERNGIALPAEQLADHEWGERMLRAALLRPEDVRRRRLDTAA